LDITIRYKIKIRYFYKKYWLHVKWGFENQTIVKFKTEYGNGLDFEWHLNDLSGFQMGWTI
jgi:hypothetical protein